MWFLVKGKLIEIIKSNYETNLDYLQRVEFILSILTRKDVEMNLLRPYSKIHIDKIKYGFKYGSEVEKRYELLKS